MGRETEAWRGSGFAQGHRDQVIDRPGLQPLCCLGREMVRCTHRLCDPLAEDGQQEEGSDGRGQVAGNRLDVVEELPTVGALDDGDPEDADDNQEHHEHSAGESTGHCEMHSGGHGMAWS